MNVNAPSETATPISRGRREVRLLGLLRAAALIAVVAGAGGSLGLMLYAGRRTPRFLLFLFVIWVLSPFVAILGTSRHSKRWPAVTRAAFYWSAIIVSLGSLAVYGGIIDLKPAGSANAFLYVAVPPASLVFMVIVVGVAALMSRRVAGA
ncbi:MAG TPA: hypothetical protein VF789_08420 [Thermoanaerobaculia bacterium]